MSKKNRTILGIYIAWDFEDEINDLNSKSDEGWQLVSGGSVISRFEYDTSVRYRYYVETKRKLKNKEEYLDSFRDEGWELVNKTRSGTFYFRKKYNELLTDSEYDLIAMARLSGGESLEKANKQAMQRWSWLIILIGIIILFMDLMLAKEILSEPQLSQIGVAAEYGALSILVYKVGMMVWHRIQNVHKVRRLNLIQFLAVIVSGILVSQLLIMNRASSGQISSAIKAGETAESSYVFESKYPDFYYLDVNIPYDVSSKIRVLSQSGDTVYQNEEDGLKLSGERIHLDRGKYAIYIISNSEKTSDDYITYEIR